MNWYWDLLCEAYEGRISKSILGRNKVSLLFTDNLYALEISNPGDLAMTSQRFLF